MIFISFNIEFLNWFTVTLTSFVYVVPFTVPVTVNLYVPFSVTAYGTSGLTDVVPPDIVLSIIMYNVVPFLVLASPRLEPAPVLSDTTLIAPTFTLGVEAAGFFTVIV